MNNNIKYIIEDYIAFNPNVLQDEGNPRRILSKDIVNNSFYSYYPETKEELTLIIKQLFDQGIKNLNCIDVSKITDFSELFAGIGNKNDIILGKDLKDVDISLWDVSNGICFSGMFEYSRGFNCDISEWDVRNGTDFSCMFINCKQFNQDLSNWNVSGAWLPISPNRINEKHFAYIFAGCDELQYYDKIKQAWEEKYNVLL